MARTASVILLSLFALAACETDNPVGSKVSASATAPQFACCGYAVTVTPKGTQVADASLWALTYTVTNTGTVTETYDLFCQGQGFAGCDSLRGTGVTNHPDGSSTIDNLPPGGSRQVTGYFHRFGQCYKAMYVSAQGPDGGAAVEADDQGYYQSNPCFFASVTGPLTLQRGNMCYYNASASGGTPPYTFTWSWHTDPGVTVYGDPQSNGTFLLIGEGGSGNIYLSVTAADANGLAASANETIYMSGYSQSC